MGHYYLVENHLGGHLIRFVGDVSQHDNPSIDLGGMGGLEDHVTMLRVLGRLKEEGDILPTSSSPTLI